MQRIEYIEGIKSNLMITDAINCQDDPCHLAWLVRDNRHLLAAVRATCSDGTAFSDLDYSGDICPHSINQYNKMG